LLVEIPEAEASTSESGRWSKKEIIGHLIDSASNNHQRFVRIQTGDGTPPARYAQEDWVRVQRYSDASWRELIDLWRAYNFHLAHVIAHTAPEMLGKTAVVAAGEVSLGYLMEDYLEHLRHHLSVMQDRSTLVNHR
jgi:hypothetical protein